MTLLIPTVIAAVGTAAAGAVPAAGITIAGFTIPAAVASAGIGLVTAGLQFGAQLLLAPDAPRGPGASRQIGTLPPLGTRYIALGRVKTGVERGAHVIHRDADDSDDFWQVVVASYGQVTSVIGHYIDGEEVTLDGSGNVTSPSKWAGLVRIISRGGAHSTTPSALDSAFSYWTSAHVGYGIAYAAVRQTPVAAGKFAKIYPNHFVRYSAVVEGAQLPDPAGGKSYSNNAARAVLWHLLDDVAGYGLRRGQIDLNSFADYAAVCDEQVPLAAGGTEARYTTNGFVDLGRRKIDVLRDLLANCDADLITNSQGLLEIIPYYRPAVYSMTDRTLIGLRLQAGVPEEQRINAAVATYTQPGLDYTATTTPPYQFPLRPGEARNTGSMQLPFCTSGTQAQRLAKKALYRANPIATGEMQAKLSALHLRPGDYITLDNTDDLVGEALRVDAREIILPQSEGDAAPIMAFNVTALDPEYDVWNPATDEQTVPTIPAVNGIGDIVDPPTINSATVVAKQLAGAIGSVIEVDYDTESADLVAELEWALAGSGDWEGPRRRGAQVGTIQTAILAEGEDYDVRLRFVLRDGIGATDWTEETGITVQQFTADPALATISVSTGSGSGELDISVTAPTSSTYYRTLIRYAAVTGSETFVAGAAATSVGPYGLVLYNQAGATGAFTITGLTPSTSYRVWAQAQNASGTGTASPNSDTGTSGA